MDYAWLAALDHIEWGGDTVTPRGQPTKELVCHTMIVDMTRPVVTVKERHLGYRFMCAEAAWLLSGDDRVETIAPYSKTIANFSDDGATFFGAYGPKLRAQLDYVVGCLRDDPLSRQAVAKHLAREPAENKRLPVPPEHAVFDPRRTAPPGRDDAVVGFISWYRLRYF